MRAAAPRASRHDSRSSLAFSLTAHHGTTADLLQLVRPPLADAFPMLGFDDAKGAMPQREQDAFAARRQPVLHM